MPVNRYGIYTAWGPTARLRGEGLGRYLAEFLNAAKERDDIRFTIVCPRWSRVEMAKLLEEEKINRDQVEIVSPPTAPFMWYLARPLLRQKQPAKPKRRFVKFAIRIMDLVERLGRKWAGPATRVRNPIFFAAMLVLAGGGLLLLMPAVAVAGLIFGAVFVNRLIGKQITAWGDKATVYLRELVRTVRQKLQQIARNNLPEDEFDPEAERPAEISRPGGSVGFLGRMLGVMEAQEARLVAQFADRIDGVRAWYCPTAFWPEFHLISKPRLMTVPDVLTSEFPAAFAILDPNSVRIHDRVVSAITNAPHMVTYSDTVKWNTLVDRFGIPATRVTTIPHAPNLLDSHIKIDGFELADTASRAHCVSLVDRAMHRNAWDPVMQQFTIEDLRYIIYPGQFRPNKNVLTLLRAFEHLVRVRGLGIKLVLTGSDNGPSPIRDYLAEHDLKRHVMILKRLTVAELAAAYSLADLAVNPSLSEGASPFTFTEAMSVGTPVIMGRIGVTEEVITDPELARDMLFNPADWRELAERIEWALDNRESLLERQGLLFETMAQRTWNDVLDDHVGLLESLAEGAR